MGIMPVCWFVLSVFDHLPLGHCGFFFLISVATARTVGPSWPCLFSGLSTAQGSSTVQDSGKAHVIKYIVLLLKFK